MIQRLHCICFALSLTLGGGSTLFVAQAAGIQASQKSEDHLDYYRKWLEEDVVYIIDPAERDIFLSLTTAGEKDQFIEQFWLRRDPDSSTPENEFREEHYRRIAYANEKFYSGIPGWRTDRGRIYIKFGPPQGVDKHPEGGFYARKGSEGGGFTATYPFEVWFYTHLDGVGEGIEIEFIDPSKSNEYRIASNPDEKDALLNVPGAGLTLAEQFGGLRRIDRLRYQKLANPPDVAFGPTRTIRDLPLQKLETLYKLERSPNVQFKDLERIVSVRLNYDNFPVDLRIDQFRISEELSLVPVTMFVKSTELGYEPLASGGGERATLDFYGRIETVQGHTEYSFEDSIQHIRDASRKEDVAVYQKRFPLRPGRYKLSVVVRDSNSDKLATLDRLIVVSKNENPEKLTSSSVLLTNSVEGLASDASLADPFALSQYKVVPLEGNEFRPQDLYAQTYFEIYNLAVDQVTLKPSAKVEIALSVQHGGTEKQIFPFTLIQDGYEFSADRLVIFQKIPFRGLTPGRYTLHFRITDQIRSTSLEKDVDFSIRGE